MKPRRLPSAALAALLVLPMPSASQEVRLDRPDAVFPEDFGAIQTVRELPDGKVLVADPLGKELYAVDLAAGTRAVIGSEGQGPGEYRQPDAVWPMPGDSTLLVDLGNGRLSMMGPDLRFGPTMPIAQGEFQPGRPLSLAIPQGVDRMGRLYFRSQGGGMRGELPDSGDIMRLVRGAAAQAVGKFKLEDRRLDRSGGPNNQNVRIEPVPLSAQDAWGVAPDGSVVVARSADYRVEWIGPDGSLTRGAAVPYRPVRIGTAEKEEYLAEQGRSGGGIGIGIEVNNGQVSMSFQRGGMGGGREIDQYTWPDHKPPFYSDRVVVDPRGRAWIRRHVDAGAPSTYDLFDRRGNRVGTILLEHGKRVVGFGSSSVYVVGFDAFDLNYLERHPLPS